MEMLRIKEKDIIVDKSELLYRADFSNGGLEKDFEIAGGKWVAENDGVLGYMEEDGGGLIYSYRSFKGDVLLDFYGKIIAPYDNDLNFTFCADGWNYKKGIPKPASADCKGGGSESAALKNIRSKTRYRLWLKSKISTLRQNITFRQDGRGIICFCSLTANS